MAQLRVAAKATQEEAAMAIGVKVNTIARKESGQFAFSEREVAVLTRYYAARGKAGSKPTPPSETGVSAGAEREIQRLRELAAYWRGRQEMALEIMQDVADLQEKAGAMQGRAIKMQRELLENTIPAPPGILTELDQRAADEAEAARAAVEAVKLAEEEGLLPRVGGEPGHPSAAASPPPGRHGRRRAGGSRG